MAQLLSKSSRVDGYYLMCTAFRIKSSAMDKKQLRFGIYN